MILAFAPGLSSSQLRSNKKVVEEQHMAHGSLAGYEELRERAPQHCRRGGKWAREKFVMLMAVRRESSRAREGQAFPRGDDPVPWQGARRAR